MNNDIKEIVETIKTLNLNINDETTQKLTETIIPVVKMYFIKQYVEMGVNLLIGLIVMFFFYNIIKFVIKNRND